MTKFNSKAKKCPACNTNWVAKKIPKEAREFYAPPYFFSRLIGIYDKNMDKTVEYICPDCNTRFPRDEY